MENVNAAQALGDNPVLMGAAMATLAAQQGLPAQHDVPNSEVEPVCERRSNRGPDDGDDDDDEAMQELELELEEDGVEELMALAQTHGLKPDRSAPSQLRFGPIKKNAPPETIPGTLNSRRARSSST